MSETGQLDDLEMQVATLDENLGSATEMAAAFNGELARVRATFQSTGQDVAALDRGISRGLNKAIRGAVIEGDSLSDALRNMANAMINSAFNSAV